MDLRKLKTLIDLVSESNISELEITEADGKVRIVKGGAAPPTASPCTPMPHGRRRPSAPAPAPAAPRRPVPSRRPTTGHVVKSPMVGTFYRSASPGATPSSRSAARSRKASRSASSRR